LQTGENLVATGLASTAAIVAVTTTSNQSKRHDQAKTENPDQQQLFSLHVLPLSCLE